MSKPAKFDIGAARRYLAGERAIRHAVCKVAGHLPRQGQNGWENFGSGWYCSCCNDMVTKDGRSYDFDKILRQRQLDRIAAGFDDEAQK